MSAFEIVVTPTSVRNARQKVMAREPVSVVLAPFSAKSIVSFDDIPVSKTARRFICVSNPSDQDLLITVTHTIDSEFGVSFEWLTKLIPSNKSETMEIIWSPKHELRAKDKIQLTDNRHFVKDVSLIFKSIDPINCNKKPVKPTVTTKSSRISAGKLKIKSPAPPQTLYRKAFISTKSNFKTLVKATQSGMNSNVHPYDGAGLKTPLREQNVFGLQQNAHWNFGKENRSPRTSASALFDSIQFTPVNQPLQSKLTVDNVDYLASLPTPKLKSGLSEYDNVLENLSNITQKNDFEITSFRPEVASTVGKEAVTLPSTELACRKLFDRPNSADSLDMQRMTVPSTPVLNETHTIISSSKVNINKEVIPSDVPNAKNSCNTLQDTFKISENSLMPAVDKSLVGTPILKKFQSTGNLANASKRLRDNQGSMPNLAQEMPPIERNRYYNITGSNVQLNDQLNFSSISVTTASIASFVENDFQAQSSRFNLNESIVMDLPFQPSAFAVPRPLNNYRGKRSISDESTKQKSASKVTPPKRSKLNASTSSVNSSHCKSERRVAWGGVKPKKFSYSIPKLNLIRQKRVDEEERVVFFNPEHHIKTVINPDAFAATTTYDPFLATTMYLDDECIEKHELNFKKWLNALVAIPWEGDGEQQQQPIDFGKLFNDVRGKDLSMAATKEVVSSNYLTKHRMESLRKTATVLFVSDEMTKMLQNLCVQIEKGALKVRDGSDIHLDIVLQRDLLELMLCFNPLWLRIGLEMIYGEIINMNHNFDILSLSRFIVNCLFKNKQLEQKYSKTLAKKSEQLKKFTLKKLFMLIVFLDKAKQHKIIAFNPCLFLKRSPYKDMKEILFKLSTLVLGNMGDIQRDLKRIGIVLTHKQTHIEEFDYAFRNLAVDLRDGIRLTKVMEIILLRDDMVNRLRVPAISRLQKVYNVDVALQALREANYMISGGITAADIADGHREKTLSLLWQLIYKFRAPKFNTAATTIQLWWRRAWLKVHINRRIREKREKIRVAAATCIQAAYRSHLSRKQTKIWHAKRISAAIILQSHIRRYIAQQQYNCSLGAAIYIQRWYKSTCLTNRLRNNYLVQRNSTLIIQKWYRRVQLAKKIENFVPLIRSIQKELTVANRCAVILQQRYRATRLMRLERKKFLKIQSSVIVIQQHFRSLLLMRKIRSEYLHLRKTIIIVQTRYRANIQMRINRRGFDLKKRAAICIQKYVRAKIEAKRVRGEFLALKKAATIIQVHYRARLEMLESVRLFDRLKSSVVAVQQRFRARLAMRKMLKEFQNQKRAAIVLQTHYRSMLEMRRQRQSFEQIKASVKVVQLRWRAKRLMQKQRDNYQKIRAATIIVQRRIVANRKMVEQRTAFIELKTAAVLVQKLYRAKLCMHEERMRYQQLRWACMCVQRRYRANKIGQIQQKSYQLLKHFATCMQQRFRANNMMKSQRRLYLSKRDRAVTVQRMFRGKLEMRQLRIKYLTLRKSVIFLQRKYRAKKAMEIDFERFKLMKKSAIVIQNRCRAQLRMRYQRRQFLIEKANAIKIQRWIRSIKVAREERKNYLSYRQSVCNLQNRYRAKLLMQAIQSQYKSILWSVSFIQRKFRANRAMNQQRNQFQQLRRSAIAMQRRFRGKCAMKQQVLEYQLVLKSVQSIQTHFRCYKLMKIQREMFVRLRTATITIQHCFRSYRLTQIIRHEFVILKQTTVFIQTRRRANVLMRNQRLRYEKLRCAAIAVQTIYRANRMMKIQRDIYQRQIRAAISIQKHFRATMEMRLERQRYLALRKAAIACQRRVQANIMMMEQRCAFLIYRSKIRCVQLKYRATLQMRKERAAFELLKRSAICIQRRFRSNMLGSHQRSEYLLLKKSAVFIQRKFRANREMKEQRTAYLLKKKSCCVLQSHFRAYALMEGQRNFYNNLKEATLVIQRRYRANRVMKSEAMKYKILKHAVTTIQRRFRANRLMQQCRKEYLTTLRSIVFIQTKFRSNLLMRKVRQEYLTFRKKVILIQVKLRSTLLANTIRRDFTSLQLAALTVQRRFRANILATQQRLNYLRIRSAALTIQHRFIAFKLMQSEQINYKRMRHAAIIIQTRFRAQSVMKKNRSSFLKLKNAALAIQTRYRSNILMSTQRAEYLKIKRSAMQIQNWFRATILMRKLSNQYKLIRCLVLCIQEKFRAKLAMRVERQKFLQLRSAAILLQQKYRANKQMIIDQDHYQRTKSTVLGLQTRIRGFIAREELKKKLTPEVLLQIKQNKCARKIQACWRGWNERKKKGVKAAALRKIRENIRNVTKNIKPEKTIRHVVFTHVAYLKKRYSVNETLNVLIALARISRIVPHTLIDDSEFVVHFCYGMMSQAIRSEADKLIIEQCSFIILNMARYEPTKQIAFQKQGLTTIAQMLLRWCDKECAIFDTLCTLIYVFAECCEMNEIIRIFMITCDAGFTLNEIKRLVARKEAMRKNKVSYTTKAHLSAQEKIRLPMLKPDFGMQSNKPYIFHCSVFAFDTILKKLGIDK